MIRSLSSQRDWFSKNIGARKLHCLQRNSLPFSEFEKYREISVSFRGSLAFSEISKNWSFLMNRVILRISWTVVSVANVLRPSLRTLFTVSSMRWNSRSCCFRSSSTLSWVNKASSLLKGMNGLCSKFSCSRVSRSNAIFVIIISSMSKERQGEYKLKRVRKLYVDDYSMSHFVSHVRSSMRRTSLAFICLHLPSFAFICLHLSQSS